MLRVLVLSTRYPDALRPNLGGFVRRQMVELAARGIAVEVVAPIVDADAWGDATVAVETDRGLRVHRPRYRRAVVRHRDPLALVRCLLPVVRDVRARFAFDAISAEFAWPEGPVAVMLGRAFDVPVSIKARGPDFEVTLTQPGRRTRMLRAAHAADGLLAVSSDVKATMVGAGLPADRIEVHYDAVDLDLFRPADRAAAKAALRLSGPVAIIVGNLFWRKQPELAIEALRELPGVTLLVVGTGPDEDALRQRAAEHGLDARVRFYGSLPHELLPNLYAAADVAIHCPSIEGLGNARLEALACGVPLVTTPPGDARHLVVTPESGRIVPPDAGAIARDVREMLAAEPAPPLVRAAAESFTWARSAELLDAYFHTLIERRRQR